MPVHAPMYVTTPTGSLGVNQCYLFMVNDYLKNQTDLWETNFLTQQFGQAELDAILGEGDFLKDGKEWVQLSFSVSGTVPFRILKFCRREAMHWVELQKKLALPEIEKSKQTQSSEVSGARMRDCLSYLRNFDLIDLINLPNSTTPFVFYQTDDTEYRLNAIFKISEYQDFPYIEPQTEELHEHRRLMAIQAQIEENWILKKPLRRS